MKLLYPVLILFVSGFVSCSSLPEPESLPGGTLFSDNALVAVAHLGFWSDYSSFKSDPDFIYYDSLCNFASVDMVNAGGGDFYYVVPRNSSIEISVAASDGSSNLIRKKIKGRFLLISSREKSLCLLSFINNSGKEIVFKPENNDNPADIQTFRLPKPVSDAISKRIYFKNNCGKPLAEARLYKGNVFVKFFQDIKKSFHLPSSALLPPAFDKSFGIITEYPDVKNIFFAKSGFAGCPLLILQSDQNRVEIISILNMLTFNDYYSSGTLPVVNSVCGAVSDSIIVEGKTYFVPYVADSIGQKIKIPLFDKYKNNFKTTLIKDSAVTEIKVQLTSDWKISYTEIVNGIPVKSSVGRFFIDRNDSIADGDVLSYLILTPQAANGTFVLKKVNNTSQDFIFDYKDGTLKFGSLEGLPVKFESDLSY